MSCLFETNPDIFSPVLSSLCATEQDGQDISISKSVFLKLIFLFGEDCMVDKNLECLLIG